jgi:hypothetical protein
MLFFLSKRNVSLSVCVNAFNCANRYNTVTSMCSKVIALTFHFINSLWILVRTRWVSKHKLFQGFNDLRVYFRVKCRRIIELSLENSQFNWVTGKRDEWPCMAVRYELTVLSHGHIRSRSTHSARQQIKQEWNVYPSGVNKQSKCVLLQYTFL